VNGVGVGRYALGAGALLLLAGSLAVAAVAVRRRYLASLNGATARLAESVIALALLTAILEFLGAVGLFSFAPIVLVCVAAGLVAWRSLGATSAPDLAADRWRAPTALIGIGLAAAGVGVVAAEWTAPTLQSYDVGIRTFDSVWYHLPWAAWFAQTHRVTSLHYTDVEYLTPFYPATAEMFHGLGIVLFGRDTLSPALNLGWLGLTLLAAFCVGRPYRAGSVAMLGGALALGTPMIVGSQAGSAANDIVGVFFLLAAIALAPGASEDARRARLVLAAVAAGLAVGVKLTLLAPVAALTVGVVWLAPSGRRRADGGVWIGAVFVAGGFWYVRNLIAVGNPLPWLSLPGLAVPAAPLQQHTGFSVIHYLTHTHIWTAFFGPGLKTGLGIWWPAVLVGIVLGPLLCLLGPDRRRRMLGCVALASLVAYLITPETAAGPSGSPVGFAFNLRYAAPALTVSMVVLPLAAPFASTAWRRALSSAVLAALTAGTVVKPGLWPARHLPAAVGVGVIAGLVVLASGAAETRAQFRVRARPQYRLAASLSVAVLLTAGAAAGYGWQRHYVRGRYQFNPGVSYLAGVWDWFRTVRHSRVGVVGTYGGFSDYPLFGPDTSNQVVYIAQHGPHGSFTPIRTCAAWRTAVNAGHFRYLVTTPDRNPWHPKPLGRSPEDGWTASDPAARLVYRRTATKRPISIYRLKGALNPAGCRRR
jgi:hypothetical protein